jgi:hypothetical protein
LAHRGGDCTLAMKKAAKKSKKGKKSAKKGRKSKKK